LKGGEVSVVVPLQKIRKTVAYLQKHDPDESNVAVLARLTLLTDGKKVFVLTDSKAVMEVVTRQIVWTVPVGLVIREVRDQVRSLPTEWIETVTVGGKKYRLDIVRDKETGTYTVQCVEIPAAIEQGDTVEEAIANGKAVIRSILAFKAKRKAGRPRRVKTG